MTISAISPVSPIAAIRPMRPMRPLTAPTELQPPVPPPPTAQPEPDGTSAFAGPRGKSEDALRHALERGVGAEHKRAHSRRFGALLDEEA